MNGEGSGSQTAGVDCVLNKQPDSQQLRSMHAPRETISEQSFRRDFLAILIFRFADLHGGSEVRENKEDA